MSSRYETYVLTMESSATASNLAGMCSSLSSTGAVRDMSILPGRDLCIKLRLYHMKVGDVMPVIALHGSEINRVERLSDYTVRMATPRRR